MTLEYRVCVWSPTGGGPRIIHRDQTTIRGQGLRLKVAPEGDGIESVFNARGLAGLDRPEWGIQPLSAVQFQLRSGAAWLGVSYGQVRIGGNAQDVDGEGYVLRSLINRLSEVTLSPGFTTPRQAAHLTVRAILRDVINSGQLGTPSLIEYDESRLPPLGFDANEIVKGHEQHALWFLERIQQDGLGLPVPVWVRFGVDAERKMYCRPARVDLRTLTDSDLSSRPKHQPPVAEKPCTRVLWFIRKNSLGDWITHASTSPDAATYGYYTQRMDVPADFKTAKLPTETSPTPTPAALQTGVITREEVREVYGSHDSTTVTTPNAPVYSQWLDTDPFTVVGYSTWSEPSSRSTLVEYDPPVAAVDWGVRDIGGFAGLMRAYLVPAGAAIPPGTPTTNAAAWEGLTQVTCVPNDLQTLSIAGTTLRAVLLHQPASLVGGFDPNETHLDGLNVHTLRPQAAPPPPTPTPPPETEATAEEKALLDLMARRHYRLPASDPTELVIRGALPPADLAGRIAYGDFERAVEAYEYRITASRGLETAVLTGQADDPIRLAQADLIKWRDQEAKIQALLAPT